MDCLGSHGYDPFWLVGNSMGHHELLGVRFCSDLSSVGNLANECKSLGLLSDGGAKFVVGGRQCVDGLSNELSDSWFFHSFPRRLPSCSSKLVKVRIISIFL